MKSSNTGRHSGRRVIVLLLIGFICIGCDTQPNLPTKEPQATVKVVPTALPVSSSTATFDSTHTVPPIPPPTSYIKLDPTSEPTSAPGRDVAWLIDLLRSTQAITITAYDSPEIQIPVDRAIRQQLVGATQSGMTPYVPHYLGLAVFAPFPAYQLQFEEPPYVGVVIWADSENFAVDWGVNPNDPQAVHAHYKQPNSELWDTVAKLAPPPRYSPSDIRYLLLTTGGDVTLDRDNHGYSGDLGIYAVRVARTLNRGILSNDPTPAGEPAGRLSFTVEGTKYEVKLWDNYFTYNGHVYRFDDIYTKVRGALSTP